MDLQKIRDDWYTCIYDRMETDSTDVTLLLEALGAPPKRVIEACCGTGRVLVPLARAGHVTHGFDMDEAMMSRIPGKLGGTVPLRCWKADAIAEDWGSGYDAAILSGNIMLNIVTDRDYRQAQQVMLRRVADSVRPGGHVFLSFDLHADPASIFASGTERVHYEGTDDRGVFGRFIGEGGTYDAQTRICRGMSRLELTLPDGSRHTFHHQSSKHIPTLEDVRGWLTDAGLAIEWLYGGHDKRPYGKDTHRAVIWAKKL